MLKAGRFIQFLTNPAGTKTRKGGGGGGGLTALGACLADGA